MERAGREGADRDIEAAGGRAARVAVLVPTRGAGGKSRLSPPPGVDHAELARAIARDTIEAALSAAQVASVTVVTADRVLRTALQARCRIVPDPGWGLNAAIAAGLAAVATPGAARESTPGARGNPALTTKEDRTPGHVAVLLGDVPALRPEDLDAALAICLARSDAAYVPDADGTGTVLLMGPALLLRPAFGAGSAAAHARHAARLDLPLPRLRHDVDDAADLAEAARLGLGRHTVAALGAATR